MAINISLEDSIILLCCCVNPHAQHIKTIDQKLSGSIDWDYICHVAKYHNISSLIYNNLSLCNNRSIIPSNVYEKLHKEYTTVALKNLLFINEYQRIVQAFNMHKIKFKINISLRKLLSF